MKQVVSLFSGCGGLDTGFKEQGFDLVYACDSDPAAARCYANNLASPMYVRDVTSAAFRADIAALGHCDVVLGGFPCQGFSKAGPKDEKDTRNTLYTEMKHAIAVLRPAIFVAENVDGLAQNFQGAYVERIIADFERIQYQVECRILDALSFGLPQHRRRIFFVGIRKPAWGEFAWPIPTHRLKRRNGEFTIPEPHALEVPSSCQPAAKERRAPQTTVTIKDALSDLLQLDSTIPDHKVTGAWPEKYEAIFQMIKEGQKLCNVRHADTSVYTWQIPGVFGKVSENEQCILETIGRHRRHKKYGNIPNGNPLPVGEIERLSGLRGIEAELEALLLKDYLKLKDGKYDLKGAMFCSGLFKRPRWDEPAPTVLTNFHNPRYFLHPLQNRPFSLRECARLQGFPDTFLFTAEAPEIDLVSGYRLVGNAVPPPLSRQFAIRVQQFLEQSSECNGS